MRAGRRLSGRAAGAVLLLLSACGGEKDPAALTTDERDALAGLARAVESGDDPDRVLPAHRVRVLKGLYADLKSGRFGFRSMLPEAAVAVGLAAGATARAQERVLKEMELTRESIANEPPDSPRAQRVKKLLEAEPDARKGLAESRAKLRGFTRALDSGDVRAAFADY